jgi:paraquat-inducible protein A
MSTPAPARESLSARYPHLWIVPAALVVCLGLLVAGLSLPLLHTTQLLFWQSHYSVWTGIVSLWHQGEYLLAIVVFLFSMIFPFIKLGALATIWFRPLTAAARTRLLRGLEGLGKWSMLDVFVVAILIVLVKLGPLASVQPRVGVYLFTAAIVTSMLTTMAIDRLARRRA